MTSKATSKASHTAAFQSGVNATRSQSKHERYVSSGKAAPDPWKNKGSQPSTNWFKP